jgi:hypothetical protein
MSNVAAINGSVVVPGEPNETCVAECERLLERARAGDIVGIAAAILHRDNTASYALAGIAGGFGMLGAAEMIKSELVAINDGWEA